VQNFTWRRRRNFASELKRTSQLDNPTSILTILPMSEKG
jgi:hypothetical protein